MSPAAAWSSRIARTTADTGGRLSTPAVAYGLVYAASPGTGTVTAYQVADGSVAWSAPTVGTAAPTVANGLVYLPGIGGMDVIDAAAGAMVIALPGSFSGEAVVANGYVVVNCQDAAIGPAVCLCPAGVTLSRC